MHDCENAEIRDLLPELAHGRLDALERERVERHVASCAGCSAELALIGRVNAALSAAGPRVNAARIATAVRNAPRAAEPAFGRARLLQLAAAVMIAVIGAGIVREVRDDAPSGEVAVQTPASLPSAPQRVAAGMTIVGGLDALTTQELETLVANIETLNAVPSAEPEPVQLTSYNGEVQ